MEKVISQSLSKLSVLFLLALVCVLSILLSSPKALADKFNTETTSSAAALGMGNAGMNSERGPNSVFYNPASLAAKDTKTHVQLANFKLDADDGLFANQSSSTGGMNFMSLSSLYPALKANPGRYAGGDFSLYPNITIRDFSIGMLYEVNQGAMYRSLDGALLVKARDRFAPTASYALRLFHGILRLGANVQLESVGNADTAITSPNSSNLSFPNSINSGSGLSKNAGMTLTLPFRFLPAFSVVARDIGNTKFTSPDLVHFGNQHSVPAQPMTFDGAASFVVYMAKRIEWKNEVDYRDISNKLQGNGLRHVFAGTELIFFDMVKIRAGLAHGYPTYGIGIKTDKASLDIAAYADELNDSFRSAKDQRYVLQYSWGLFK